MLVRYKSFRGFCIDLGLASDVLTFIIDLSHSQAYVSVNMVLVSSESFLKKRPRIFVQRLNEALDSGASNERLK